jgi:hypothetical protein
LGIQPLIFFSMNTSHGLRSPLGSPNSGLPGGMKLSRDRVVIDWAELDAGIHIDSEDDWGCQVPCSGNGDEFSGCGEKGFSHKLVRSPPQKLSLAASLSRRDFSDCCHRRNFMLSSAIAGKEFKSGWTRTVYFLLKT